MSDWTRVEVINLAKQLEKKDGYIDVVKLADELGIDVFAINNGEDFNARISHKENDGFQILVNENHPETRRRFSIAHEISHFVLDRPKLIAHGSLDRTNEYKDDAEKKSEQQADDLAAELLMPQETVEAYLKTLHITTSTKFTAQMIIDVANHFHVSKAMAITRLRKLGFAVPYIEFA